MSTEEATLVAAVFTLLAAVIAAAGAAIVSKRRLGQAGRGQPPSWLKRCLTYLGSHLRLALAALFVSMWLVPLGLYIVALVIKQDPEPAAGTCKDISVPSDYARCQRDIWLATKGTCEVPSSVFALSTGSHDSDMRVYCIQLALKHDKQEGWEGRSLKGGSSLPK